MHKDFQELADKFSHYSPPENAVLGDTKWAEIRDQIQVVIPAGGKSRRMQGVTGVKHNKITMPLPNGDTLLEYNIRMYRDSGLEKFILLIGHKSETVQELVGDGSKLGVEILYSEDPEKPVATGGAMRWALEHNAIDRSKYLIVHNGGDIFVEYPGDLPREFVSHHVAFEKMGSTATILSAPMSLVQGSALKIVNSFVEHINYEAYVPVPYHTAATMFSPSVYPLFEKLFQLGEKMEFEKTLFPYLAERKLLTAMKVDNKYFIPVKNEKQWGQLIELFTEEKK